jgi:spectinomycin phosphotransferase
VDTPPPATVHHEDLVGALNRSWALTATDVQYLPKGAGSYHWLAETDARSSYLITVDDLDRKPWIANDRDGTFDGLEAAYEATLTLHDEAGLAFVVGPVRSDDESVLVRLSDRYSMAVFPYLEGFPGRWGQPMGEARTELPRLLARLHDATPFVAGRISHRDLDVPKRQYLMAALDAVDRPWKGGTFSEPARRALAHHASQVAGWLDHLDHLAAELEAAGIEPVVTHGEPHPGNLIRTDRGLRLIDWDTVALAGAERDLWMLADATPDAVVSYEQLTGRRTNGTAIAFYRLAWTLTDIALLTVVFRSPHPRTRWVEQKWRGLNDLLGGAPSSPYGGPEL